MVYVNSAKKLLVDSLSRRWKTKRVFFKFDKEVSKVIK